MLLPLRGRLMKQSSCRRQQTYWSSTYLLQDFENRASSSPDTNTSMSHDLLTKPAQCLSSLPFLDHCSPTACFSWEYHVLPPAEWSFCSPPGYPALAKILALTHNFPSEKGALSRLGLWSRCWSCHWRRREVLGTREMLLFRWLKLIV